MASWGHHVLQGLAMQRLFLAMAERNGVEACDFEFVMVAGHFLARDENIFTFFEGVQVKPPEHQGQFAADHLRLLLRGHMQDLAPPLQIVLFLGCLWFVDSLCFTFMETVIARCVQGGIYITTRCTIDKAKRPSAFCPKPWRAPKSLLLANYLAPPPAHRLTKAVDGQAAILPPTTALCCCIRTIVRI